MTFTTLSSSTDSVIYSQKAGSSDIIHSWKFMPTVFMKDSSFACSEMVSKRTCSMIPRGWCEADRILTPLILSSRRPKAHHLPFSSSWWPAFTFTAFQRWWLIALLWHGPALLAPSVAAYLSDGYTEIDFSSNPPVDLQPPLKPILSMEA